MRVTYWTFVIISATVFVRVAIYLIGKFLPTQSGLSVDLIISAWMTAFYTPVLYFGSALLLSSGTNYGAFLQYVVTVSIVVCITRRLALQLLNVFLVEHAKMAENDVVMPRLARRLPDGASGRILRLTVEDHFVDVITDVDSYRIRMRFSDAVDEMEPCIGFCTHRSHWVALDAVAGVHREAGKVFVRITNGDLVPISRKYRSNVEEAGFL